MSERGQFTPKEAQPKKEPMSDAQIGDLLAAIGNHEGKALLLASMQPNEPYTRPQLRGLIRGRQGADEVWTLDQGIPFKWSEKSLAPIGLVARDIVDPEKGIVGYMMTEKGEELGQAFAGHFLDFSEKHPDVSLYHLFGSTKSSAESKAEGEENASRLRAPITRLRLFTELVTSDLPVREADIVQSLSHDYPGEYRGNQSHATISKNLESLSKNNILGYKSTKADGVFSFYKPASVMPEGNPSTYRGQPSLTSEVFAVLRKADQPVSSRDVQDALIAQFPEKENQTRLTGQVSGVLRHFEKEGYVESAGEFINEQRSEILMDDEQKEMLIDLVTLIEKFREGDPQFLAEGKAKAAAIVHDTERFSALLEKAKNASSAANQTDRSETSAQLGALIVENPESSRGDLQEAFYERYGKRLGDDNINLILRGMRKAGEIEVEKKGSKQYYSVAQKEASEVDQPSLPESGTIFESPQG